MSLSVVKLDTVSVYDPRISKIVDGSAPKVPVLVGATTNNYNEYPSTSFSSSSSSFNTPPPDNKTILNKNIQIKHTFDINFTGTSSSGNLLKSGYDGLASFPIAKAISNCNMTLNNQVVSLNYSDIYPYLFRYEKTMKDLRDDNSATAYMLDSFQDLNDWQTYGSARNSLAEYGENVKTIPRGLLSSPFITILSNTPTSATVRCVVIESLFIPSLSWDINNMVTGLVNVNTLSWSITYNNNLSNIWSHNPAGGSTLTNINVIMNTAAPVLYLNFMTASLLNAIPPTIMTDYFIIDRYVTSVGNVNAGASFSVTSNNIQLSSVPKCIYLYCNQTKADQTYTSTDTFASLDSISFKIGNRDSLLSSANSYQLWTIAKKNGLQYSYVEWSKFIGSLFCVYFDEDVNLLDQMLSAGVSTQLNLQVKANFKNISSNNINFDFVIICIHEGVMTISQNSCVINTSIISKEDVYKAVTSTSGISSDYQQYRELTGRGLFDSISKVNRFINRQVIPAVSGIAKTINKGQEAIGSVMSAVSPLREISSGAGVLTKQDLRQNVKNLM